MLVEIAACLGAILVLLAIWQRRLEARERVRVVAEIREAKSIGADVAVGQHPQIDPIACIGCGSCARACPESGVLELVGGIAHVVQASKCVGHGLCADACPVNGLVVGLGNIRQRPDIPRLTEQLETTVPGIFIAGELGGLALIRHAVEQGTRAMDVIARRRAHVPPMRDVADVAIVGAGPGGLAATMRAIEHGLTYITIEQADLGGTVRKYPRRKLVMTQPVDLPLGERLKRREYVKEELVEFWESLAARHGIEVRSRVRLTGLAHRDRVFELETTSGTVRARFVLLALGRRGTPRRLQVPGEERETVLYQLVDAATYRNRQLLVVGGGDSAIEAATGLADQPGNEVTLSYRKSAFFRLKSRNEERIRSYADEGRVRVLFESSVERFGDREAEVALADSGSLRLPVDFTFVFAGGHPPFPLLQSMGIGFGAEEAA